MNHSDDAFCLLLLFIYFKKFFRSLIGFFVNSLLDEINSFLLKIFVDYLVEIFLVLFWLKFFDY